MLIQKDNNNNKNKTKNSNNSFMCLDPVFITVNYKKDELCAYHTTFLDPFGWYGLFVFVDYIEQATEASIHIFMY